MKKKINRHENIDDDFESKDQFAVVVFYFFIGCFLGSVIGNILINALFP